MRRFVERVLGTISVALLVSLAAFGMIEAAPGDPLAALVGPGIRGMPTEVREDLRRRHGLDRPAFVRYLTYLGGVLRGDLGTSLRSGRPVFLELAERAPATGILSLAALLVGIPMGVGSALLAASASRGPLRHLDLAVALVGVAVPVFVIGLILILVFADGLSWLPATGYGGWRHLVLPAFTLGLAIAAPVARLTRAGLRDSLAEPYIRTARAKGVGRFAVLLRHALRASLLPLITLGGLVLGRLFGGAVLVESVFAWPGVGRLLVEAIVARDLPLVQGSVLAIALTFVLINAVIDAGALVIDPRSQRA